LQGIACGVLGITRALDELARGRRLHHSISITPLETLLHVHHIGRKQDKKIDMATAAEAAREGSAHHAKRSLAAKYMNKAGVINVGRLAEALFVSRDQLAQTAGLATTTLRKKDRSAAPRPQARLREMVEILDRIDAWAGGEAQALAWYRSQPIPALNGRTAEALVQSGDAALVRSYLDHLALGGFA
jgi:hypothetical protein